MMNLVAFMSQPGLCVSSIQVVQKSFLMERFPLNNGLHWSHTLFLFFSKTSGDLFQIKDKILLLIWFDTPHWVQRRNDLSLSAYYTRLNINIQLLYSNKINNFYRSSEKGHVSVQNGRYILYRRVIRLKQQGLSFTERAVLYSKGCPLQQGLSFTARAVLYSKGCPLQQGLSFTARAVLYSKGCPLQQGLSFTGGLVCPPKQILLLCHEAGSVFWI